MKKEYEAFVESLDQLPMGRETDLEVRSLVPRLRPYPKRSLQRWGFATFWRENREQWLAFAIVLIVVVMIAKGSRAPF